MNPDKRSKKVKRDPQEISFATNPRAVLWFSLIAFLLVAGGSFYYKSETRRIREVKASELSAIAQMKVEQIRRWQMERVRDAMGIADSPAIKKLTGEWLLDPARKVNREELMGRLRLEEDLGVYFQALLVDADQRILLSSGVKPVEMEDSSWATVKKSLREKGPVFGKLHHTASGKIRIDIATAIRNVAGQLLAVLVLTANAEEFLFPMIQSWPTSSSSGETLLVRREGDDVLFLNELRFRKNAALNLRFPLSQTSLPAVQAALGRTGTFYGKDYSGTKVIADLRPVPGTSWYLVAKESTAKMQGEVRSHTFMVFGALLMAVLCVAGGMAAWNQMLQIGERKRAGALLRESEAKFRILFEEGMDGVVLANPKTKKFMMPNAQICRMLGYRSEEFENLTISDIHPADDLSRVMEIFEKQVRGEITLAPELPVLRKDGTIFYADITAKTVDLEGDTWTVGIFRDVSERKRLERELVQAKEAQFKTLIDTLPSKVFLKDRNSVYLSCNQNYAQDLGIRSEEIVGKTDYDFFPTHLAEKQRDEDKEVMRSGAPVNREEEYHGIRAYLAGSQKSYINIVKVPVRDGEGNVTGLLGFFWDVTEQRKMQEELKQQSELLRKIIDSTPDFIFAKDLKLRTMLANKAYAQAVGKTPKEMIGHTDLENGWDPELVRGDPRKGIRGFENDDREALSGKALHNPYDLANTPAGIRIFDTFKMPLFDNDQNIIGMLGIARDITDHKITERELRESKALIEAVVENVPLMIFLKEAKDLRFVVFNRAGEELLGYDRKALIGKNNLDLFPPEQAKFFMAKDREVLDGEAGILDIPEEPILTAKKGERLLHTRKICIRGADGVTKYLLGISEDITEQKMLAAEKNRVEVLASTAEAKTKFTSAISHELRSPIAVIIGALEIALECLPAQSNDELKEVLQIAKKNSERLLCLIGNVLDFQKIESGKMEYNMSENDLREIAGEICQSMGILAKGKGLDLRMEWEEGLPKIKFDRDKLTQVMTNLMSNAIRHTGSGSITLAARKEKDVVHVRVQDTGEGIPPEEIPKLFQPFEQVGNMSNRQKGGTGLGLVISKEIILAHHGKIWAESVVGKGSSFHFVLPI